MNGNTDTSDGEKGSTAPRWALNNGISNGSGGDTLMNGHAPSSSATNGDAFASTSSSGFNPIYPGSQIDREEFVRLTLQALQDAGFTQAATSLSKESGFTLESPTITTFRNGILQGKWETVSRLLQDEVIVEGEALSTVRFLIAEQKFLEHLESRETKKALSVLRNELAPLNHDPERLHQLSSYMMCARPSELRYRSGWSGAGSESRKELLEMLQHHIPASVMIPQRRLETLLEQAKEQQRTQCRYHLSDPPFFSLYSDHGCDRNVFPTVNTYILDGHSDEVWRLSFNHEGDLLASAGQDGTLMIWQVRNEFARLHTIQAAEHSEYITSLAWSPDDTMLLLGVENAVKVFDVATGRCKLNVIRHDYCAVGGVAWLPNSAGFFSGGLDMRLFFWDLDGQVIYAFNTNPYRIVDIAVSPDATRLVCLGEASHVHKSTNGSATATANGTGPGDGNRGLFEVKERRIIIFNLKDRVQERSILHPTAITCVTFPSDDSRYALINQAPDEVVLYDIIEGTVVKRYKGQKQGKHMIRSCFGGSSNNFVISGSEDSMIYVWHKNSIEPIEVLGAHGKGSVNDVAWNPGPGNMFASAGDDRTIRIWQAPSAAAP